MTGQASALVDIARTRSNYLVPFCFLLLSGMVLNDQLPATGDSASYINLSENLVRGNGYVSTLFWGPGESTMYPPLYPLALVPIIGFGGGNYLGLKVLSVLFGLWTLYLVSRMPDLNSPSGIALLTGLSPCFLFVSSGILSESLYLPLSLASLLSIRSVRNHGFFDVVVPALLMAAAFYARTIGIAVVLGGLTYLISQGQHSRALRIGVLYAVLVSPWVVSSILPGNIYTAQAMDTPSDGNYVITMFRRIGWNAIAYSAKVAADLAGGPMVASVSPYSPAKIAASLCLSALAMIGFYPRLRAGNLESYYVLIYVGICLIWPFHDWRFIFPLLPFLLAYAIGAAIRLVRPLGTRVTSGVWAGAGLASLVAAGLWVGETRANYYDPGTRSLKEASEWVADNTEPDTILLARKPRLAAVWSQRKVSWLSGRTDPADLVRGSGRETVYCAVSDFEIGGENLETQFRKLLVAKGHRVRVAYETSPPVVRVYELTFKRGDTG